MHKLAICWALRIRSFLARKALQYCAIKSNAKITHKIISLRSFPDGIILPASMSWWKLLIWSSFVPFKQRGTIKKARQRQILQEQWMHRTGVCQVCTSWVPVPISAPTPILEAPKFSAVRVFQYTIRECGGGGGIHGGHPTAPGANTVQKT